ncbi:high-potential iron-sulfur protein [Sphingobium boeckii]|uniref:High-potential iron-sulfur protein n=1 Tax=Sphingobium boeckii TaxID=1082345 RepID=A0A7W9EFT7_9SPHN|nr:high-potential iron-sulfur protein [Sphingobium boeckii]MBB5686360.1 hypothetical protein [Sphingobium boeckii]
MSDNHAASGHRITGPWSRRSALALFTLVPLALTGASQALACADPATLSAAQKSMRKSLGFRAPSADPKKGCGTCAFFTLGAPDCGKCALLSGGQVPANGVCDSWAQKA